MREAIIPQTIRMLQERLKILNKTIARFESERDQLTLINKKKEQKQ